MFATVEYSRARHWGPYLALLAFPQCGDRGRDFRDLNFFLSIRFSYFGIGFCKNTRDLTRYCSIVDNTDLSYRATSYMYIDMHLHINACTVFGDFTTISYETSDSTFGNISLM